GAGGQHACAVAGELRIERVLCHGDAGLLSAYGIGMAEIARHRVAGVYRAYSENEVAALAETFDQLAADARREIEAEEVSPAEIEIRRALDLRYRGVDASLTIPEPADGTYAEAYAAEHRRRYGYLHESRPLEILAVRVAVVGRVSQPAVPSGSAG